ncbi:MAG TPA: phosphatase PAP2 family protein [Bauldia sp.]|nr:phosphatase PAP2 family protein [Bauldia sp.]
MIAPFRRIRDNWDVLARTPLNRPRPFLLPTAQRAGVVLVGALALVLFVGVLYDARLIGFARELPVPIRAFFGRLTRFGQSDWLLIPSGALTVIVALGDWRAVSRTSAAAWREIGTFAFVFFLTIAATGIVADIIKPIVGRFRPDFVDGRVFAPLAFGGYGNYSFPSGHATTMATVAIIAAFVPGRWTPPILVAAALVAISRIVIAAHFPSDVVAGTLLGLSVGWLMLRRSANLRMAFVVRPDGRLDRRFGVLGHLRRRHRLASLLPALWLALRPQPLPIRTPDQP